MDFIRVNRHKRSTMVRIADQFSDLYTMTRKAVMDTDQLEKYLKLLKELLRDSASATSEDLTKQVWRLSKDELTSEALVRDLLFITKESMPQRCPSTNLFILYALKGFSVPKGITRKLQAHIQECSTCQRFLEGLECPLKQEGTQNLLASLRGGGEQSLIDTIQKHFTNKLSGQ